MDTTAVAGTSVASTLHEVGRATLEHITADHVSRIVRRIAPAETEVPILAVAAFNSSI